MVALDREIWLLRHGATEWSDAGRYCGQADPPLLPQGRRQVLRRRGDVAEIPYQYLWSSDLRRCLETARLVAGDPIVDRRLREFDFGTIEGLRFGDLDSATQDGLVAFDGFAAPGGENVSAFCARIDGFFDELPAGRHLIVTHGGVIRVLLRRRGRNVRVPPGGLVHLSSRVAGGTSDTAISSGGRCAVDRIG